MIDTQKNKSVNKSISYVTLKVNMLSHTMSLESSISCVSGISIFGFNEYYRKIF